MWDKKQENELFWKPGEESMEYEAGGSDELCQMLLIGRGI